MSHAASFPGAENAATLLANLHRRQRNITGSYLSVYLPAPMLAVLESSPKSFAQTLYGDVATSQVYWNASMLATLADGMKALLSGPLQQLKADPHCTVTWPARGQIEYQQLKELVFVGKLYLEQYLADSACVVADPVGFLLELCAILASYANNFFHCCLMFCYLPVVCSDTPQKGAPLKAALSINALLQRQNKTLSSLAPGQLQSRIFPALLKPLALSAREDHAVQAAVLHALHRIITLAVTTTALVEAGGITAVARLAARAADNDAVIEGVCIVLAAAAATAQGPIGRQVAEAIAAESALSTAVSARLSPSVWQVGAAVAGSGSAAAASAAAVGLVPVLCVASKATIPMLAERGAALCAVSRG